MSSIEASEYWAWEWWCQDKDGGHWERSGRWTSQYQAVKHGSPQEEGWRLVRVTEVVIPEAWT